MNPTLDKHVKELLAANQGRWRTRIYRGSTVCALGDCPWPDDLFDLKGIVV